jgi:hypothetical protein
MQEDVFNDFLRSATWPSLWHIVEFSEKQFVVFSRIGRFSAGISDETESGLFTIML